MMSPGDMTTPVTRGELRQEIDRLDLTLIAMKADIALMATKADLAQLAMTTKADLAQLAMTTKADLEIWGERLLTDLARHTKASAEALSRQIAGLDDKYTDLPARVTHLEAAVFAATPRKVASKPTPRRSARPGGRQRGITNKKSRGGTKR